MSTRSTIAWLETGSMHIQVYADCFDESVGVEFIHYTSGLSLDVEICSQEQWVAVGLPLTLTLDKTIK